jgi:hypothetical protein
MLHEPGLATDSGTQMARGFVIELVDSKRAGREAQGQIVRSMWTTHTHNSELIRETFFRIIDRAVEKGSTPPISLVGDMLCVKLDPAEVERFGAPHGMDRLYVMFPTPAQKVEFVEALRQLLLDSPDAPLENL